MRRGTESDRSLVVRILSQSFDKNKSVNHVVKQDNRRRQRIEALMNYSFDTCLQFGEVWVSDDELGCALLVHPEKKKTTFKSLQSDIQLASSAIGLTRIFKVLERESAIKANHPAETFTYLWFIGVDENAQKKGIGSVMLKQLIQKNLEEKRPLYLETSVMRNLPWYKKFGFELYKELDLGYTLYLLRRPVTPLPKTVFTKTPLSSF